MGLFLGNVHVLSRTEAGRTLAVQALRKMFTEQGYAETSNPESALVNIVISTSPDRRWTSAYCQEWESDTSVLMEVSAQLSKQAKAAVVSLSIHDSDLIFMVIYEKGKRLDGFANDPDCASEDGDFRGKPQKWKSVIDDAEAQKQLRATFDAPCTFVEDKLPQLASILKIPVEQLRADSQELEAQRLITLSFSKLATVPVDRICLERSELMLQDEKYQAWLKSGGTPPKRPVPTVGERFSVSPYFINRGIAFQGFTVTISGSALTEGIVSVRFAVAKYHATSAKSAKQIGFAQYTPTLESSTNANLPTVLCRFNEVRLTSTDDTEDRFRVCMHLDFHGEKTGAGVINVRVTPGADENASIDFEYPIEIAPGFRKPLKFTGNPNDVSYLRTMSTPTYLFGVAITSDNNANWPVVQATFENLLASMARKGETLVLRTIEIHDPASDVNKWPRPKKRTLDDASTAGRNRYWNDVAKNHARYQTIEAQVEGRFGMIYQLPLDNRRGSCPHIGFWVKIDGLSPEEVQECEQLIASAIGQLMQTNGLQAFMDRWSWTPEFDSLDRFSRTPYEQSCIPYKDLSKAMMQPEWCTNYLRGLGKRIWLGAQLLARVGGPDALKALPSVSYGESFAEIYLESDAVLDQAEAVLERVLPNAAALSKI